MDAKPIIKVVEIPQTKVVSFYALSMHPEEEAYKQAEEYGKPRGLYDNPLYYQVYGFDNPVRRHKDDTHGREVWIAVPDDYDTGEGVTVKSFEGGLYAMVSIKGFIEMDAAWGYLIKWVKNSEEYESGKHQHLERHVDPSNGDDNTMQLELLIPIARRA